MKRNFFLKNMHIAIVIGAYNVAFIKWFLPHKKWKKNELTGMI